MLPPVTDPTVRDVIRAQEAANWYAQRLARLAELSEAIADRLYLRRNWTPEEQEQQRRDVAEREEILTATRPSYGEVMTKARELGQLDPAPVKPEKMIAGEDGWSEWRSPHPGYRMVCCDCGLIHAMDFQITRDPVELGNGYKESTIVEDPTLHIVFRARRVDDERRDQTAVVPMPVYRALLAWSGAEPSQSVLARAVDEWQRERPERCEHGIWLGYYCYGCHGVKG